MVTSLLGFVYAYYFEEHDDAVEYINKLNDTYWSDIDSVSEVYADNFKIVFKNSVELYIQIKEVNADRVKFHLIKYTDDTEIETRRFSNREFAVEFVKNEFNKLGYETDELEDETGEWRILEADEGLNVEFKLFLILSENEQTHYHRLLGLKGNSTKSEIRKAYRKKSKELHPDTGGDEKKFKEIHDAYEALMTESSQYNSKNTHKYRDANISYLFQSLFQKERNETKELVRKAGKDKITFGLIITSVGSILTLIGYELVSDGGRYIFFYGAIIFGIWNIIKGVYWLLFPGSITKK